MKHAAKKPVKKDRNWLLVFVALLFILIGLALLIFSAINIDSLGWMSLWFGLAGIAAIGLATMAIITNDPTWILLELVMPN